MAKTAAAKTVNVADHLPAPWAEHGLFYQMAQLVPPGHSGRVTIDHFTIHPNDPQVRAFFRPHEYVPPGTYCRLLVNGGMMMSDTYAERRSNARAVREATGHVLIGGLGIGMVLLPILAKPDVTRVTVVEKNLDVIGLVEPAIRSWRAMSAQTGQRYVAKLQVLDGDVRTWEPPADFEPADYVYLDIWPDICQDDLDDHKILRRRFRSKRFLAKGGRVHSWQFETMQDQRRRDRNRGW